MSGSLLRLPALAQIGSPAEIGLGEDNPYIYDGPSVCVHHSLYFINTIDFGGLADRLVGQLHTPYGRQ